MSPCWRDSGVPVRTRANIQFDVSARVVHTFWPVTTYWSPSRTALVMSAGRSEPASGSDQPWHHMSSARTMRRRNRSFWARVPWRMSVGPTMKLFGDGWFGTRAFVISSW